MPFQTPIVKIKNAFRAGLFLGHPQRQPDAAGSL